MTNDPLQDLREILRVTIRLVTRLRRERDELRAKSVRLESDLWIAQRRMEILEREYSKLKVHLTDD